MRKYILQAFVIASLITVTFTAYSQLPGGTGDDPGLPDDGTDPDGTDVPLDGGVVFLLAAGAAYGYTRLKDRKQECQD